MLFISFLYLRLAKCSAEFVIHKKKAAPDQKRGLGG